jgi:hypothetical protein
VPGKQGARGHEAVHAEAGGQQPGQGGEHGAVSPVWLWPGDLAAQYGDPMTEHQDLCILGAVASREESQPGEVPGPLERARVRCEPVGHERWLTDCGGATLTPAQTIPSTDKRQRSGGRS